LLAMVVAVSMKLVGALLSPGLLVIPAMAGVHLAQAPWVSIAAAAAVGIASVSLGLLGSIALDTPTGPTVIVTALIYYGCILLWKRLWR
jgi:zinc transport system permease protein